MTRYLLHRLGHTIFVVVGVITLVFFVIRLSGDPTVLFLGEDASATEIVEFRQAMGWDRPLLVQYLLYARQAITGNLGDSLYHAMPALELVLDSLPATFELTAAAMLIALVCAVPIGILSAIKRNTPIDGIARAIAMLGVCIPNFWLAIMLIIVFSVNLGWLPSFGRGTFAHLLLPGFALGFSASATIMRLLRSSILDVLQSDYIRTARAKGVHEQRIVLRHVLRNAALPVVTIIGLQLGSLLSGAVVTETVFAYPGIGRLAVQAIRNRDFAVVQAFVAVSAVVFTLANLVVDLTYMYLDPRIRY